MSSEIKQIFGVDQGFDRKSTDFLSSAIVQNSLDGFDYIKFKKSLKEMARLNLDEGMAIQSAFATASTIGLTKATLVNSAKHYMAVLMNEKSQFDSALNNQVKQRVASKKEEVLKLEQKIQEFKQKIEELNNKIREYGSRIDSADEEVEQAKQKIQDTKDKFDHTFTAFVKIIEGDIEQFNQHLQ